MRVPACNAECLSECMLTTDALVCFDTRYRNYMVCNLPQIAQLDGDDVSSRERDSATDVCVCMCSKPALLASSPAAPATPTCRYMNKALKFAKRMQDLVSENEQELIAIEARRQRNWLSSGAYVYNGGLAAASSPWNASRLCMCQHARRAVGDVW